MKIILSFCLCFLSIPSIFGQCNGTIISCGEIFLHSTVGQPNNYLTNTYSECLSTTSDFSAGDREYQFTLTETQQVKIFIKMLDGNYDLDLFLFSECIIDPNLVGQSSSPANCIASSVLDNFNTGILTEGIDIVLPPGTYYFIVDGYNSAQEGTYELSMTCDCLCAEGFEDVPIATKFLCEDFSTFSLDSIALQSNRWRKWDNVSPSLSTDAEVVEFNSNNVLRIAANTGSIQPDLLYNLENQNDDVRYRLSWNMYVETGKEAYYNIQRQMLNEGATDSDFAYQVAFNADGTGELQNGNGNFMSAFSYKNGEWNTVMQIIDLDQDIAELWINGNFIFQWQYSFGSENLQIGAIDFFATPNDDYLIDNLCFWKQDPLFCSFLDCEADNTCIKNGDFFGEDCTARCYGLYTSNEMQQCFTVCEKGGPLVFRNQTFEGTLQPGDLTPGRILGENCVLEAYDFNLPQNLNTDVYIFYNEDFPGVNSEVDINLNSADDNTRGFVFFCECEYDPDFDMTICTQNCLGEVNDFTDDDHSEEGFFYIAILGEPGSEYNFSIIPEGICAAGEEIFCGEPIGDNVGNGNNLFSVDETGNYESVYNGFQNYNGNELVYYFNLTQPAKVNINLTANEGMGFFLYNYLCGLNALDYAENDVELGGTAALDSIFLSAGTYYIVVDKMFEGGDQAFDLAIDCFEDDDFFVSIFDIEDDYFDCPEDQNVSHVIGIENSLDEGGLFKPSHRIQFMQKNETGDTLINVPSLQKLWVAPPNGEPYEFIAYEDAAGDTDKCSYFNDNNDTIFVAVYDTENYNAGGLCTAVFKTVGTGGATGGNTFSDNKVSIIESLNFIDFSNFGVSVNSLNISPDGSNKGVQIITSRDWTLTEQPNSNWVSITNNAGAPISSGSNTTNISINVDPNPSRFPREMRIKILYDGTPQTVNYIDIKQQGICLVPDISISPVGTVCEGEEVTLTVNIANGVPGLHDILWNTNGGDTTETVTITNPTNAAYAVTVTDKFCNAREIETITLTVNDAPIAPFNSYTETICQGATIPPLIASTASTSFVEWYDAENGGTFLQAGLEYTPNVANTPGTYTFWAQSIDNTTNCKSFTRTPYSLEIIPAPTVDVGTDISICPGETIMLTANANGGSGNYSYDWNGNVSDVVSPTVSPTTTTTYSVTVNDGSICEATDMVQVTVFPTPTLNVNVMDAPCGSAEGSVTAMLNDVASPYSYNWSNGGTTATISNLLAGDYSVIVSDINGCTLTASATVATTGSNLAASIASSSSQPVCPGTAVMLTANGSGGNNPFTYQWNDNNNSTSQTITVNPLMTTDYEVTLTDGSGCTVTSMITVQTTVAPTASITNSNTQAICPGAMVMLTANGNGNNFTYQWDDTNNSTQQAITVSPNTTTSYSVTLTDGNGCTAVAPTQVVVNPAVQASAGANSSVCTGSTVNLLASATGGSNSFVSYNWNIGAGAAQTAVIQNTTTFFVTITDSNGCTDDSQVTISANPLPSATTTTQAASCDNNNGEAFASGFGGNSPYIFNWSNGQSGASITNLSAGIYTVTITDANMCTSTNTAEVTNTDGPEVMVTPTIETICLGNSTMVCAEVDFGTPPYMYEWSVSAWGNDSCHQANPTIDTDYSVTITDANGCSNASQGSIIVEQPMTIDFSNIPSTEICDGESIIASANLTGNYSNLEWTANVAGTFTQPNEVLTIFNPTPPYPDQVILTLTLMGNNAECNNQVSANQTITVNPLPELSSAIAFDCNPPQTEYFIQFSTDGSVPTANFGNITDLNNNEYLIENISVDNDIQITLTTPSTGCETNILFLNPDCECNISPAFSLGNQNICESDAIPTLAVSVDNDETVNWYADAAGTMLLLGNSITYTPTVAGTYYAQAVSSINSCESMQLTPVTLTIHESPIADAGNDQSVCFEETVTLTANTPGGATYNYEWNIGNTPTQQSTEFVATADTEVQLIVGVGNCFDTTSVQVEVFPETNWSIEIQNPLDCANDSDGIISIPGFPAGVIWNTGNDVSATLENLSAGDYSATVTDVNSCESVVMVSLEEPPPLIVNVLEEIPDTNLMGKGRIVVDIAGGTPNYHVQLLNADEELITEAFDVPPSNFIMVGLDSSEYTIQVFDANNCLILVTMVEIGNIIVSGVSEAEALAFNLFPNPTTGIINLQLKNRTTHKTNIQVLNILGQVVERFPQNMQGRSLFEIDLSTHPKGVYWVQVNVGETQLTKRVVLQ